MSLEASQHYKRVHELGMGSSPMVEIKIFAQSFQGFVSLKGLRY